MAKRLAVIAAVVLVCCLVAIFAGSGEDIQGRSPNPAVESSLSDVPEFMNYQAVLIDSTGKPLNGIYNLTFRIYDSHTAPQGNEIWSETHSSVLVENGLINVVLGTVSPGLAEKFNGSNRWLEVEVQGLLLAPRQAFATVPYAFRSGDTSAGDNHSLDAADGNPEDVVYVDEAGNVGVGITEPNSKSALHVAEDTPVRVMGTEPHAQLKISGSTLPDNQLRLGFQTREDLVNHRHGFIEAAQWSGEEETMFPLRLNDGMYVSGEGNIGLGTSSPQARLHITEDDAVDPVRVSVSGSYSFVVRDNGVVQVGTWSSGSDVPRLLVHESGERDFLKVKDSESTHFIVKNNGDVGIGTDDPEAELHILSPTGSIGHADLRMESKDGERWNIGAGEKLWFAYIDGQGDFHDYLEIDKTDGEVEVKVLTITGGSDLAEPFDVVEPETIEPGMVVAIDPDHPGKLKVSERSYDRCVAGIVSGAGGIRAGMTMAQEGMFEGDHQVALTGRVYGLCDAAYGSIEPGDLLTTSPTPGYAMKVADYEQAQGAVIGKAMTGLELGQGLVLVLVTLQ